MLLTVTLILLVCYIYYVQFYKISTDQVFIEDLIKNKIFKTGDMIIFKAYNNFNSIFTGSYFGHCGIVFIDPLDIKQTPMLFESNGIESVPLKPRHNKNGVFLTPLEDRIKKYKGRVFLKSLNYTLPVEIIDDFKNFIQYAVQNMYYDYNVISSGIKKGLGIELCSRGTNCGQLTFLSLIKLNLLPMCDYNTAMFHHLKYVCNITDLNLHYRYLDMIEIIDHPFRD